MERLVILTIWRVLEMRWLKGTFTIDECSQHRPHVRITGINAARKAWLLTEFLPNLCNFISYTVRKGVCDISFTHLAVVAVSLSPLLYLALTFGGLLVALAGCGTPLY